MHVHGVMNVVIGSYLPVAGAFQPRLELSRSLLRLHLLNGSNASIYQIRFKDSRQFHVIVSDGGFQECPVAMTSLVRSAGECGLDHDSKKSLQKNTNECSLLY